MVVNFGTLCWLLIVTPLCWTAAKVLTYFRRDVFGWISQIWDRKMFYNDWIGIFSENYLFLGMCAALNFNYFVFNSYGNVLNSTFASIFAAILATLPVLFGVLYRRFTKLVPEETEEFLEKYGNGIEGLNFKRQGNLVLVY